MTDYTEALALVKELLSNTPAFGSIPNSVLTSSLKMSAIPDSEGRFPNELGYVDTYDPYYAAYMVCLYAESVPTVTSASSEGTSVSVTGGGLDALKKYLSSMSFILSGQGDHVLQQVVIPEYRTKRRLPMGGSDVDTDLG